MCSQTSVMGRVTLQCSNSLFMSLDQGFSWKPCFPFSWSAGEADSITMCDQVIRVNFCYSLQLSEEQKEEGKKEKIMKIEELRRQMSGKMMQKTQEGLSDQRYLQSGSLLLFLPSNPQISYNRDEREHVA